MTNNLEDQKSSDLPTESKDESGYTDDISLKITDLALDANVDLREYSQNLENRLRSLEEEAFQSYMKAGPRIAKLYHEMKDCDAILSSMESILTNFHKDLGDISSDIQDLQRRSMFMHQRLQNRQAVRGEISQYLADIVVPEVLIKHILFTPVTEQDFLEHLHELDHKVKFAAHQTNSGSASSADVILILQKLTIKAVIKLREYLLQKIAAMRKPLANYQVPQAQLLKYRFYMEFLSTHDRITAKEIRVDYVNTMSKIYYSYFKAYATKLSKLQIEIFSEKDDLLGRKSEDILGSSASAGGAATPNAPVRQLGSFSLGERAINVLADDQFEGPIMIPHTASKNDAKYPIEVLFRSTQFALFDTSCREFFFLNDFFSTSSSAESEANAVALFEEILGKTVAWIFKHTESQVQLAVTDVLGLLLCIQVIHSLKRLAADREVPILCSFWEQVLELLWPKVTERLDLHANSLRTVENSALVAACSQLLPGQAAVAAAPVTELPKNGQDLANMVRDATSLPLSPKAYQLIRIHPLTRRWAELAASLSQISHESPGIPWPQVTGGRAGAMNGSPVASSRASVTSFNSSSLTAAEPSSSQPRRSPVQLDQRISLRLIQMQSLFEAALGRLSEALPRQRLRLVFLINNYDHVISVLLEHGAGDSEEANRCRDVVAQHRTAFVDQALLPYFGSMLMFLGSAANEEKHEETRVTHIIRGFNIDWKNSIEKIHSEILNEFSNFTLATQIFQAMLSQLVHYYHEFQKLLHQHPYKSMPISNQLVSVHEILNGIKKFNLSY